MNLTAWSTNLNCSLQTLTRFRYSFCCAFLIQKKLRLLEVENKFAKKTFPDKSYPFG